jgi:dihydrofolate synthase/folylpolyglutamate synthase
MTYLEAIEYLHGLMDYEKKRIDRYTPETLDLSRVERLLEMLSDPHRNYASVHIAGTKGKGSTAAMIESILRTAGYRTGLYTSPHLHTFRERIRVGEALIGRDEVVTLVQELQPLIERVPGTTTFEAITVMAFLYFSRKKIDLLVTEVGLGGRLDATNVIIPEVSVITSLSKDHTYLLGDTLPEIAREKAGIIKPGVPVVSAPQRQEALDALEEVSRECGSTLFKVGQQWTIEPNGVDTRGQTFTIHASEGEEDELTGRYWIPLIGRHQLENATTAVAAIKTLRDRDFKLPRPVVDEGLRSVTWPGRMEILSQDPLVLVDCAHNPYSTRILREALEEWFPGRRWILVFGASSDKDIDGMLRELSPITDHVIVTRSEHPRAASPTRLADIAASIGGGAEISVNVTRSLQRGLAMIEPDNGLIFTGSIFLVTDARDVWAAHNGHPLPENDRS